MDSTTVGPDGQQRCSWCATAPEFLAYHDTEWGFPVSEDRRLFEKLCLESFQSGLSWRTILVKRENFRAAFHNFDFNRIARFTQSDVDRLLLNSGIVRHRGKIEAVINNAHRALELVNEFGTLAAYVWQWEPGFPESHIGKGEYNHPIPSITKTSQSLSHDLKRRGWKFFGPTTAYAFMQAMGLVNDHMEGCAYRKAAEDIRHKFERPTPDKFINTGGN